MQTANITDEFSRTSVAAKPRVAMEWLWSMVEAPNLMALDAPIVAIVWQTWLSTSFLDQPIPLVHVLLFVTVWLIYIADRLLDCRRLDFQLEVTPRHQFVNKWRWTLWPIWFGTFIVNCILAVLLIDVFLVIAGAILFGTVLLYGWMVHGHRTVGQWLPKEFFVAGLFSLGVCLPILVVKITTSTLVLTTLLTWLFLLNCFCVAAAQHKSDGLQNVGSAIRLFPTLCARIPLLAFLLIASAIVANYAALVSFPITVAISISSIGLMVLAYLIDRNDDWRTRTRYALFADYALLSPPVGWILFG